MAPKSRVQVQQKTRKWGDVTVRVEAAIRAEARAEEAEARADERMARADERMARADEMKAREDEMKAREGAGVGVGLLGFLKRAKSRFCRNRKGARGSSVESISSVPKSASKNDSMKTESYQISTAAVTVCKQTLFSNVRLEVDSEGRCFDFGSNIDDLLQTWDTECHILTGDTSIMEHIECHLHSWFTDRLSGKRATHFFQVHQRLVELGLHFAKSNASLYAVSGDDGPWGREENNIPGKMALFEYTVSGDDGLWGREENDIPGKMVLFEYAASGDDGPWGREENNIPGKMVLFEYAASGDDDPWGREENDMPILSWSWSLLYSIR
ncbi:uncharacterized protein HD556DRAFT_1507595 [Suillus plorans]|uniref:Uncharacterized protein n=1 Tax=Suillus plorans TaxID=116603 RepID=A0A9P7DBL2_9AGAM|nr:uncharacterized protein HD556DRAFT_1507595 [Suillus plorans]KAG1786218.1 hypothetical protein HD556DRAFT_1507595 [Suillus plorans]